MSRIAMCQSAPMTFVDRTTSLGLTLANGPACCVDLDSDGWVDVCDSAAIWKNNKGTGFTKTFDIGSSVAADFDNDGRIDLFCWSNRKLYRNMGDMMFREFPLPELPKSVSRGACWADFDGNGFVDLYIGGYEDWNAGITWPSMFLANVDGRNFTIRQSDTRYRARGVTACDFDNDGDLDVYVSNYRLQPNVLWLNEGENGFKDVAAERGTVATSPGFAGGHSIGSVWADFNNDGLFDLFAGNFAHQDSRGNQPQSRFLQNLGLAAEYHFKDRGTGGVHYQESYASPTAADFNSDGNLDLFFTTVYGTASFGRPNHPALFAGNGQFEVTDVTTNAQLANLPPTYQSATADFDNDGDLDLLTAGRLFLNSGSKHHWLRVRLNGDGAKVHSSAIGAQVRIQIDGKTHTRQVEAGTGEGNQNELTLHFGLGTHNQPVDLQVLWPDGRRQHIRQTSIDRKLTIDYVAEK